MIKRVSLIATALFIAGLAYAVNSQDRTVGNNLDFQETNSIKRLKELGLKKLTSGATPPAGSVNVYAKSDGNIYKKDESGQESLLGGGEGGAGGIVINKNPGFEQGTSNWTASGGTFTTTTNAADVGFGTRAGTWDASASGQTLSGDIVTVPAGLYGKICSLSFYYKGGDSNIKAQVYDGTNVLVESSGLATVSSYSAKQYIKFPCPTSGQLQARFYASGDAAPIYIDDVRLGQEMLQPYMTSGATFDGYARVSGCDSAFTSSTSFINPSMSSCTYDNSSNVTVNGLQISFPTDTGYKYKVTFNGSFDTAASNSFCTARLYDGTTYSSYPIAGTTGSTDKNAFFLEMFSEGTGSTKTINVQVAASSGGQCKIQCLPTGGCLFNIERIPTTSVAEQSKGISIDKSGWRIDANIGGANPSLSTGNVSSYTEITNAGLDLVLAPDSAPAEIPCSGTNPSTGLTCSAGSESIGVVFTPPTAGKYEVCFDFSKFTRIVSDVNLATYFQVVKTPNNAQTILDEGGSRLSSGANISFSGAGIGPYDAHHICGVFLISDTSKQTFRLMYEQLFTGSGSVTDNNILSDRDSLSGQRDIKVSVRRLIEFQDAVKFTNLVTTGRESGLKLYAAKISAPSGGNCAVADEMGSDWVNGTPTSPGTGQCTIQFNSGIFTYPPACTCTPETNNGRMCSFLTAISANSVTTATDVNGGGLANIPINITCVGY